MKKLIAITALVTLFSANLFAAPAPKKVNGNDLQKTVAVTGYNNRMNIVVSLTDAIAIRPVVQITDRQGHQLCAEKLGGKAGAYKSFDFSELEAGDYTLTVTAGQQEFKKQVHIYEEEGKMTYFFIQ